MITNIDKIFRIKLEYISSLYKDKEKLLEQKNFCFFSNQNWNEGYKFY